MNAQIPKELENLIFCFYHISSLTNSNISVKKNSLSSTIWLSTPLVILLFDRCNSRPLYTVTQIALDKSLMWEELEIKI